MNDAGRRQLAFIEDRPLYPVILATAPVLLLYLDSDTSIAVVPRPLIVAAAVAIGLTLISTLVLRSRHRGAVAAAALVLLLQVRGIGEAAVLTLLGASIGAVIWLVAHWRGIGIRGTSVTSVGNTVGVLLLVITGAMAVGEGVIERTMAEIGQESAVESRDEARDGPSIHVLLLDAYPRADVLESLFAFDNQPFLSSLEEQGFHVAARSRSNYPTTEYTLASVLHMSHMDELPFGHGSTRRLIQSGRALDLARQHGYTIRANRPPWDNVAIRSADVLCESGFPTDVEDHLLAGTVLGHLARFVIPEVDTTVRHAGYTEHGFECLAQAAHRTEPTLSLTHLPVPHLPLAFDKGGASPGKSLRGDSVSQLNVRFETFADAYRDQLEYLNGRILSTIDEILTTAAGREAVIIVMSDHGPEPGLRELQGGRPIHLERYATLFASRTPLVPNPFDDAATTVNVFPVLFNSYLDTDLTIKPATLFKPREGFGTVEFVEAPNPDAP